MVKSTVSNQENDIKTHQWVRESYPGIRVYQSSYSNFEFPKHFHNYFTIQVVDEGINRGFTNHLHYQLGIDTVLIINPGEIHAGASKDGNRLAFSVITIEEYTLRALLAANEIHIQGDIVFDNRPIDDPTLAKSIRSFIAMFSKALPEFDLHVKLLECLRCLSHHLLSKNGFSERLGSRNYLVKARDYIRDNYHKDIRLNEIAATCGVSEYHLLREFKGSYRLTPFEYLRNFRVEKARELLKENASITQVALQVGFYDHSHFLKNFKRITGMLPRQSRG